MWRSLFSDLAFTLGECRGRRNKDTMLAEDMSLVTDNNINRRKISWQSNNHNSFISKKSDSTSENVMTSKSNNLLGIFGVKNSQNISYVKNERNAEEQNGNIPSPDKLPQSIIDGLKKLG
ncbi:hypothetical protein C2G38_2240119 [Gigaspora rosea]|uniref:Uncharacterized protein n=1 Tax=Gigaspora rosea TaxID=44941 RepID=A0A397VYA6_9GLOM|nr:hypothetical protein C2G38_2240119 [Gigaspora rosea]